MTAPRPLSLPVALALLAGACSRGDGRGPGPGPRAAQVRAVAAVEKDVPIEVRAVGRIVSSGSVAIRAQVGGMLVAAHFVDGQAVRRGDLLLEIDRRPLQAAVSEAAARLEQDRVRAGNAREDASRLGGLVDKEYVTRQQYDAARANAAALEAQVAADDAALERARLNLAYTSLRAPISGRTGRLLVHPGNLVSVGALEPLVTIEQVKPVFAEFALPERHLAALRARRDAPALVTIHTTGAAAPIEGSLVFVNNAVDPGTGTILLRARFPNDDEALWPGQPVGVTLRLAEQARAVVVPAAAVASGQQGDYAYVVVGGKAEVRPVVVDQASETEVVVGRGLAAGDLVVTEGQLRLRPGAPVELLTTDAPPSAGRQVEGRAPPR